MKREVLNAILAGIMFALVSILAVTTNVLADTYYYVRHDAPNDEGVVNGDPNYKEDCWQTISQAFADLKSNPGGGITGEDFIIQVEDSAVYVESVFLDGLTTTSTETLILRSNPTLINKPTINATTLLGEAIRITNVAYVTIEGFILKANQTIGDEQYRVLWANQSGLDQGLLTVRNNVFDGQKNEPAFRCNLLQIRPMRIDCIISGNEFTGFYNDYDDCPLLSIYTETSGGEPLSLPEAIISDNVFYDNIANVIIYNYDDYMHTAVVERNQIYGNHCSGDYDRGYGGIIAFISTNGEMIARNNLIYNNDYSILPNRGAILVLDADNKKIYNNTLYNNKASGGEILIESGSDSGVEVKNNIICPSPGGYYGVYLDTDTSLISATNLFYADFNNDSYYNSATDYVASEAKNPVKRKSLLLSAWNSGYETAPDYSLYGDPGFVGGVNFHIERSSICRDAGVDLIDVTDDIDQDPRLPGSYDIGADEFSGQVNDVAIISVDAPASVIRGATADVIVTVKNVGTQDVDTVIEITLTDSPLSGGTAGTISNSPQSISELKSGESVTLTFSWDTNNAPLGEHTLTANHNYNDDNSSNDSTSANSMVIEESPGAIYVANIAMHTDIRSAGPNDFVYAIAEVTVESNGVPIDGATVYGDWIINGVPANSSSGITIGGVASLESNSVKNPSSVLEFGFTVIDIVKDVYTYIPGLNTETSDAVIYSPPSTGSTALLQAFPSPGNPEIWIPFTLSRPEDVIISIYDVSGYLVRSLDLGFKSSGKYLTKDKAAYWDGRNEAGEQVASGIYFYTFQAGDFTATKKMIIAR